ncbi:MAG: Holliday junction branch migration protein RuvA [Betaproteobacteria bacterium]|nr:Holliday junction branch migration protein RuvA [Betaproteobacteria bacterium]
MIGRLRGTLLAKQPPQVLVEAGGVGYEIDVPMSTLYALPALGAEVTLLTHLVVREDAHLLYGFATDRERATFRELLRISGVGPKVALAVLSGLSTDDLARAVAMQDTALLTRVPGIGKKTAERLLLELKGRLADALPGAGGVAAGGASADVMAALVALGYNEREAAAAVKTLAEGVSVEEGIRAALKALAR